MEFTYTGWLKGIRLTSVYDMGLVTICGAVESKIAKSADGDEAANLDADWSAYCALIMSSEFWT